MNGQNQELAQRVRNKRLAAVGPCFPNLNLIIRFNMLRPAERETRARKYNELCCMCTIMELAVCVSLLESATP